MTKLAWDAVGERRYEAGVDRGVLYVDGVGVAWSGLVSVSEAPSGGEPEPLYIDGVKYLTLYSDREFAATIEAFTYPDEFIQFEGIVEYDNGLYLTLQDSETFGLCYRTKIGNDVDGLDYAYKLHLVYGASVKPSGKDYQTIADVASPTMFTWDISTEAQSVANFNPTAHFIIDSRDIEATRLGLIESILYGYDGSYSLAARLPSVSELLTIISAPIVSPTNFDGGTPADDSYHVSTAGAPNSISNRTVDGDFIDTDEGYLISDGAIVPTIEQRFVDGDGPDAISTQTFDGGAL